MKLDKYVCDNQMSIFDLLETETEEANEPPVLLEVGQTVYKVIRGDVLEYYVYNEKSWLCGESNRGYRLKEKDGVYDCAWNSSIGINVFTDKEQAEKVAESFLNKCDCIRKENIVPVSTVAYSYVKECDNREMITFYSLLENDMVYVKEFMTYQHICKDANKAIKNFMKQHEFKSDKLKKIEYQPNFKNMYACKSDSEWCYAEARYNWYC